MGKKVKNFNQKKDKYERCMVDPECEVTDIKKFKLSKGHGSLDMVFSES